MNVTTAMIWVIIIFVMAERFIRISIPRLG